MTLQVHHIADYCIGSHNVTVLVATCANDVDGITAGVAPISGLAGLYVQLFACMEQFAVVPHFVIWHYICIRGACVVHRV